MKGYLISQATKNNWKRLSVDKTGINKRLSRRANKSCSTKNFVPVEYFSDKSNLQGLNKILLYARENKLCIESVIYNLALNYLYQTGLICISDSGKISSDNEFLTEILLGFSQKIDPYLLDITYPVNERDFLGIVYQSLLKEGSKNKSGSYYSPEKIIKLFKSNIKEESLFLDPCCGTGSFLLTASEIITNPENLYGCDIDKIACFITKINLIVRYRNKKFKPNIYNINFLTNRNLFRADKFDIIATNPPWGAITGIKYKKIFPQILSGESFSYFIFKSFSFLKDNGYCAFVLPESILSVASHQDIRKFILETSKIKKIHILDRAFSGVLSKVVVLELVKSSNNSQNLVQIISLNKEKNILQKAYKNNKNYNFSNLDTRDFEILNKIYTQPYETLGNSLWGIGIVTGNNKKHLSEIQTEDYEKIYTGKDITKYFLKPATKFIKYDRRNFQQTAPDKLYRAKDKLIYKFISKVPVFAYDNSGSLVLNSANILIPEMKTHSIKTVLAFLNSDLFRFIYTAKFNELKILKGNLLQLPFPVLDKNSRESLEKTVNKYIKTKSNIFLEEINNFVFTSFNLSNEEIEYISHC